MGDNNAQKLGDVANPPANPPPVVNPPDANAVVPPVKPADAVPPVVPPVDGVKPPESPPDDKSKQALGAPDKYVLKVPENSHLSDAHVESLKAYAKEKGMTNDAAQSLLEREHNASKASIDSITQKAELQSQAWLKEAKADKEIGGDNFPKTVELANHALNSLFPGSEIRAFMDATGFGNNPVVLRGFAKIGKMLTPGSIVQPNGQPPPKKDPAKTMYDHPSSQQKS